MTDQETLDRWERRAVEVNGLLLRGLRALEQGRHEQGEAIITAARELAWETRKELLATGAVDSVKEEIAEAKARELAELEAESQAQADA